MRSKKFVLELEIGNDAMITSGDIARALAKVGKAIVAEYGQKRSLRPVHSRTVRDDNGNTVGGWNIVEADHG